MHIQKNWSLIIGFSIPVLMIIFVALSIYLPGVFLHPKYNFLYSTNEDYYYGQTFGVNNGRLIKNPPQIVNTSYSSSVYPQLYVHDVSTNQSKRISFEEAQNLDLNSSSESPDGYRLEDSSRESGFFPFFWYDRDISGQYLIGHNLSQKENLVNTGPNYYSSTRFIGWIIQ